MRKTGWETATPGDLRPMTEGDSRLGAARPIAFDGLRGWLHEAPERSRDTGVILISPIGRDGRCAYMPMRLFAEDLACGGYPTLRYDHRGCGDSLDLADDADMFATWREDITRAVAYLRAQTGVRRVVLGGLRLGGAFAALAAEEADGLILLAPILNGRSWLRRLRFSTAVLGESAHATDELVFDAGELCLSKEAAAAIGGIDLAHMPPPAVPVFVAAQNAMVGGYADGLARAGAAVRHTEFPGFKDLFAESHSNLPPREVFDSARAWLTATFPDLMAAPPLRVASPADDARLSPPGAVEQMVRIGDGLWGVLCLPDRPAPNGSALVFCSTGGDPRAGVGGFATQTARELALRGVASLRFDYSGLGDSPMPGADPRCHVFETPRGVETDAAIAFMAARGYSDITLFGVCAGAYHALRSAWANPAVTGVFAVSPVKLVWRRGDTLTFGRYKNGRPTGAYLRALADPAAWRQVFAERIDLGAVLLTLLGRLRSRLTGWVKRHGPRYPLRQMEAFARRGGRSCMVMGVNDASLEELETYFGRNGGKLRRLAGATINVIPQLDHGLACNLSRRLAAEALYDWLFAPPAQQSAPVAAEKARPLTQSGLGCSPT